MAPDAVHEVEVPVLPLSRLHPLIGDRRFAELELAAAATRDALAGITVWNVNSTATGGGVAEMLQVLVGYILDAGVRARWLVIHGDPEFFVVTKRVHNRLHGVPGDDGALDARAAAAYGATEAANTGAVVAAVAPGDVVVLHDPQTAALAGPLADAGALVVWRCHVGTDVVNEWTEQAWAFLRPHLEACAGFVFSRQAYVPAWMAPERVSIIPPSIDPFSPKNAEISFLDQARILGCLGVTSVLAGEPPGVFVRRDGSPGVVTRAATVVGEGDRLDPVVPVVVQVSRWDHLKDMRGVMVGFAEGVVDRTDAHLLLVGPDVHGVTDDPEGRLVLEECVDTWRALPPPARRRIRLVSLPMEDVDENAAMVNALQRHATVVVQKSLAEGFGLTVAEAMWKAKPVLASAVGGIVDLVAPGTGVLLDDPTDLGAFADALASILGEPDLLATLGGRAHRHVLEGFVGDTHLLHYASLVQRLVGAGSG
ncbi:MAG TPA: glycosyltransferase [Acidimicrobiales bacterium]|nr:glycosyltransferase [Acidimicrobiales bacterium]